MHGRSLEGIGMTSRRTRQRLVERLHAEGIHDARVLGAISNTPRHLFVDEALASRAYEDSALPIGFRQTISQPYIVALMTQTLLENREDHDRVLEIGTGCGYQTMVLAQLVERVYTVERIGPLLDQARDRLGELQVRNVRYRHGDGFEGWREGAPFSGVLVTAAPQHVPDALFEQLAVGGVMILPEGGHNVQRLVTIIRTASGLERGEGAWVHFVPMLKGIV